MPFQYADFLPHWYRLSISCFIMLKSWSDLTAGAAETVLENLAQRRAVIPPGNAKQADLCQNLSQITSVSCSASRLRIQNLLQGTGLKMKSCGSTCHSRGDHITISFSSIPPKKRTETKAYTSATGMSSSILIKQLLF